jgi:hypothetical protein
MRPNLILIFLSFITILSLTSCSYDKPEEIKPVVCDLTDLSYADDIAPILKDNCYECHGPDKMEAGIRLDSYNDVKTVVDFNLLLGVIRHDSGYPAMPDNRPKLDQCSIDKIASWIAQGTKDN